MSISVSIPRNLSMGRQYDSVNSTYQYMYIKLAFTFTEQVSLQAAIEFAAHSSFNLIGLKYIHQLPVHSWKEPKCWLRGSFFHNKKKYKKDLAYYKYGIEGLHIFGIGCTWNALWFQHWAELQSCLNENFLAYIVSQKRSKTQWKKNTGHCFNTVTKQNHGVFLTKSTLNQNIQCPFFTTPFIGNICTVTCMLIILITIINSKKRQTSFGRNSVWSCKQVILEDPFLKQKKRTNK